MQKLNVRYEKLVAWFKDADNRIDVLYMVTAIVISIVVFLGCAYV